MGLQEKRQEKGGKATGDRVVEVTGGMGVFLGVLSSQGHGTGVVRVE